MNKKKNIIQIWLILVIIIFLSSNISFANLNYLNYYKYINPFMPLDFNVYDIFPWYRYSDVNYQNGQLSINLGINSSILSSQLMYLYPSKFSPSAGSDFLGTGSGFSYIGYFLPNYNLSFATLWSNAAPISVKPVDKAEINLKGKQSSFVSAGETSQYTGNWGYSGVSNYTGYTNYGYYGGYAAYPSPEIYEEEPEEEIIREIEEADIIKIEGTDLYLLNEYRGLIICNISDTDNPSISGRATVNGEPEEMYIRDDRAYIIVNNADAGYYFSTNAMDNISLAPLESSSRIVIVDLSEKSNPHILGSYDLSGEVTDSRIVGDILYVVSSEKPLYWPDAETSQGKEEEQNQDNIFIASLNVSDPSNIHVVDREDFGGFANYIHVWEDAIFVESKAESNEMTIITYVDISDPSGSISVRGSIEVPGYVMDEFKMDYYNGYFRVCTYKEKGTDMSLLHVIDTSDPDNLRQCASLELALGEQLFATRFDGDRAYMVTFRQVDPLWVIDLSDPNQPWIAGELQVPGWSTHIESRGDRLIALGVDDTGRDQVCVSLFDVSDTSNPSLIERISFGEEENGWSSSVAYDDIHAFTILDDMGMILLPYDISYYDDDDNFQEENRLQIIDFTPDDLTERGWVKQKGSVLRSQNFEDRLFSVSTKELQVIDATDRDNPQVTASVTLVLDLTDFIPLDNGYGVQLVCDDSSSYSLRAVPLSSPHENNAVSEIELVQTDSPSVIVNGNMIYIITAKSDPYAPEADTNIAPSYYYTSSRIRIYDFTDASNPQARGSMDIPGSYTQLKTFNCEAGDNSFYYYNNTDLIQFRPDVLVLNLTKYYYPYYYYGYGYSYSYSSYYNGYPYPYYYRSYDDIFRGFLVVDLSEPDDPKFISRIPIDITNILGLLASDDTLYFSYWSSTGPDGQSRPLNKYYLGRIDLSDPANPVEMNPVNTPGYCIGLGDSGSFAYTIDNKWNKTSIYTYKQYYSFNVLKIHKDKAYLLDEVALKNRYYSTVIDHENGYAYFLELGYGAYENASEFAIVNIGDPDHLIKYEHLLTGREAKVFGARSFKVFISNLGGVGCYDVTDPGQPQLEEFRSQKNRSNRVRFKADKAYLPLGNFGLWAKNL